MATSPSGTVITTVGPVITDANGNTWGLNSTARVVINGTPDLALAGAQKLAFINNQVWVQTVNSIWYYRVLPTDTWSPPAGTTVDPITASNNRVPAPIPAGTTVTTGNWILGNRLNVGAMPHGFIAYDLLLPQGYNPSGTLIYPVLFYGHENTEGSNGSTYPSNTIVYQPVMDGAFNTVIFRRAHPAIIVVPYCDQTDGTGGTGQNFAGYNDTPNSGGNEQGINALALYILANYKADPNRMYCTGDSLGGIGSLAWMIDNNQINGAVKIWTAGMGFADQLYRPANGTPNNATFAAMQTVPYIAVSQTSDGVRTSYDQPAWTYYTGNTSYPTSAQYDAQGVSALKAGASNYYYLNYTGNQNSWDAYRQMNGDGGDGTALYALLFSFVGTGGAITPPGTPTPPVATGVFRVVNGFLVDPSGNSFVARGINVYDSSAAQVVSNAACTPLLTLFPNCNFIRLACFTYNSPSYYANLIQWATAKGIYVAIEDHTNDAGNAGGGQGVIYTGSRLNTQNSWYAALALAYINNPYVGFMTTNEPSINPSIAALSAWHVANYNAIRNTGSKALIGIDVSNIYTWGTGGGMTVSAYAPMTGVYWDPHIYGFQFSSANLSSMYAQLVGFIAQIQQIPSADGTMPCIIGECGISTDGNTADSNGVQTTQVAQQAAGVITSGAAFWNWYSYAASDNLTDNNNNLTTYGQQVAGWMATLAATTPTPPVVMPTDPVTIATTWNIVNGIVAWTPNASVSRGARVSNGGSAYQCVTAGVTASSGGPNGTTGNITDGTAHWAFLCAIGYTDRVAAATALPLTFTYPLIWAFWNVASQTTPAAVSFLNLTGHAMPSGYTLTLTAAPSESLRTTLASQSVPFQFNAAYGASFLQPQGIAAAINYVLINDPQVIIDGLGFVDPLPTTSGSTMIQSNPNNLSFIVRNCIIDGGSQDGGANMLVTGTVGPVIFTNCLIIDRQPTGGVNSPVVVQTGATVARFVNCTFIAINGGVACSPVAPAIPVQMRNCAIFGYLAAGNNTNLIFDHCVTDSGGVGLGADAGGNNFSTTAAACFISPTTDFRPTGTSPLIGAGVTDLNNIPTADDIARTPRTQGANWDVGAWARVAFSPAEIRPTPVRFW